MATAFVAMNVLEVHLCQLCLCEPKESLQSQDVIFVLSLDSGCAATLLHGAIGEVHERI